MQCNYIAIKILTFLQLSQFWEKILKALIELY